MAQIYDSLKSLINQEMISRAAIVLEENENNVKNAAHSIIAGLLGVMLKKGNTPQIKNIFEEAGKLNLLSDIRNIVEEKPTQDQQRIGDDFLQHLLGDKAADFSDPIAQKADISRVATNRLVSMIAPVFCGYFGNKLVKENWSMDHLMKEIENQKNNFSDNIPANLVKSFDLSSILEKHDPNTGKKKKKNGWITWAILIILLILIIALWRSCKNDKTEKYNEVDVIEQTEQNKVANSPQNVYTVITLSDGTKLNVAKGGIEEKMINFLNSNEYKNATAEDLKNHWFVFDNIRFEFNSSTKLMSGSEAEINNIITILKNYKDAKIRIGGFADKVGTENVNMEISKERARTIENMLEKGGLGSQVVKAEGFGEEYAKHNVNESDDARSEDRDIALRFVK
ncbi:MAG: DUF937 domain-containing protein [Bacteroidales bacterium]|jgi:outer membrane protein OmpA-like peptidoglycan-associated protein|nr:DUF937 domain-containing protein [Bacteroidales bacterium]